MSMYWTDARIVPATPVPVPKTAKLPEGTQPVAGRSMPDKHDMYSPTAHGMLAVAARQKEMALEQRTNHPPECEGCLHVEVIDRGRVKWQCIRYDSPCKRRARWASWHTGGPANVACHVWLWKKLLTTAAQDDPIRQNAQAKLKAWLASPSAKQSE